MLRIVVVAYHNDLELAILLNSLERHIKVPCEVVVWDNGGTLNAVVNWLSQPRPNSKMRVSTAGSGRNLGFGAGVNAALDFDSGVDWDNVLLINPDAWMASDLTPDIYQELQRLNGIVGLKVFNDAQLRVRQASARSFPNYMTALTGREGLLTKIAPTNPWSKRYLGSANDGQFLSKVDWVSGCALFVSRPIWKKIGGFDPRFFLYVEDVDLCKKASEVGVPVYFSPAVSVVHAIRGSAKKRSLQSDYQHHKGMWLYFWKWATPAERLLAPFVFVGIGLLFLSRRAVRSFQGMREEPLSNAG